jgi:hypothetical protein
MVIDRVVIVVGLFVTFTFADRTDFTNVNEPAVPPVPLPQGIPVPVICPVVRICAHCVVPVNELRNTLLANVCAAVHVFGFAGFNDATTFPVVGDITRLPSAFDTLDTLPPAGMHVVVPSAAILQTGLLL